MTHMRSPSPNADTRSTRGRSTGWTGWLVFAACIMLLNGVIAMIEGLMALVNENYFHLSPSGLPLSVNYTVWGFVHLVLGAALFASGIGVLSGNVAARAVGVLLAAINAVVTMLFIEAAPGWGVILLTVDIVVIYALTVHGSELRNDPV